MFNLLKLLGRDVTLRTRLLGYTATPVNAHQVVTCTQCTQVHNRHVRDLNKHSSFQDETKYKRNGISPYC